MNFDLGSGCPLKEVRSEFVDPQELVGLHIGHHEGTAHRERKDKMMGDRISAVEGWRGEARLLGKLLGFSKQLK
jgi:hypothetical protein